jgi:hypothetical protein
MVSRFEKNSNGAIKNMRNDSTKCEINLLHEIQERSPQMHTTIPKNKYWTTRDVTKTQYHVTWKVFPNTKDNSRVNASKITTQII